MTRCLPLIAASIIVLTTGALEPVAAVSGDAAGEPQGKLIMPDGEIRPLDGEYRDIVALAVATLAEDLGIAASEISVDSVRPVQWPDTSIGCPQPGYAYGQVITPGHKITLRVGKALHFVHEANGRAIVCERRRTVGTTPDGEVVWAEQASLAREDLARRLGVPAQDVVLTGVRARSWPDGSLGCPQPGVSHDSQAVQGYELRLRLGGRSYTYHTDLARVIPCPPITED